MSFIACLALMTASGANAASNNATGNAPGLSGGVFATGAPGGGSAINHGNQAAPVGGVGYSPLTAAECRGLGGKVQASTACSLNGGTDVCVTVDSDGVVRRLCISK
jgi:hypothetical protein